MPAINQLQPLLLLPQAAQFIPRLCCLRRVLAQANPAGKLVYIVRQEDGVETILVTTRAAAEKRGDKLPPGLESPAEEKKNKA